MQIVSSGRRRIIFGATGCGGAKASACLTRQIIWRSDPVRLPVRPVRRGWVMPSLAKIWDRCTLTVPGAMNSRRAMASLRRTSLTRRTTSRSAGAGWPNPWWVVCGGRLAGGMGHRVVEGESRPSSHARVKRYSPRMCRAWLTARAAAPRLAVNPGARYSSARRAAFSARLCPER
jgi:hypothetical protein